MGSFLVHNQKENSHYDRIYTFQLERNQEEKNSPSVVFLEQKKLGGFFAVGQESAAEIMQTRLFEFSLRFFFCFFSVIFCPGIDRGQTDCRNNASA